MRACLWRSQTSLTSSRALFLNLSLGIVREWTAGLSPVVHGQLAVADEALDGAPLWHRHQAGIGLAT